MKSFRLIPLILAVAVSVLTISVSNAVQKPDSSVTVPKYEPAAEATFKGTVEEVRDHQCPVSGGMGSHLILRRANGSTIEVHLATTKFMKSYDLLFKKGDVVEVVGVKVQFEGVETILAREVTRGDETFVFRAKDGTPVW